MCGAKVGRRRKREGGLVVGGLAKLAVRGWRSNHSSQGKTANWLLVELHETCSLISELSRELGAKLGTAPGQRSKLVFKITRNIQTYIQVYIHIHTERHKHTCTIHVYIHTSTFLEYRHIPTFLE